MFHNLLKRMVYQEMPLNITKKYITSEEIHAGITANVIPEYSKTKSFADIKTLLMAESKHIPCAIVNSYTDKHAMKQVIIDLKHKIDASKLSNVLLYNELVNEINECHHLQTSTDGRFGTYEMVHGNVSYIHEFTEFLGYVDSHLDIFFSK